MTKLTTSSELVEAQNCSHFPDIPFKHLALLFRLYSTKDFENNKLLLLSSPASSSENQCIPLLCWVLERSVFLLCRAGMLILLLHLAT